MSRNDPKLKNSFKVLKKIDVSEFNEIKIYIKESCMELSQKLKLHNEKSNHLELSLTDVNFNSYSETKKFNTRFFESKDELIFNSINLLHSLFKEWNLKASEIKNFEILILNMVKVSKTKDEKKHKTLDSYFTNKKIKKVKEEIFEDSKDNNNYILKTLKSEESLSQLFDSQSSCEKKINYIPQIFSCFNCNQDIDVKGNCNRLNNHLNKCLS